MNKIFISIVLILFPVISLAQTYSVELIEQRKDIVVNRNRLTKEVYYEIKINSRAGERFTKVRIPYSEMNNVSNIDAYIKDANDKVVKKLRRREIEDKSLISDISLYEDHFVKEFTLKHNSYPYTLVYSYTIQEREFLYIGYWIPVISERIPTRNASLKVSVPVNYTIDYANHFIDEPKLDTIGNTVTYTWNSSYTDIIKQETLSPVFSSLLPRVSITPDNFHFDKQGSFRNWESYGDWQYEIMEGLSELPDSEKKRVLSLTENTDDIKEKIKILYHYLQDETRYINVSIGTGGMKPYPAAYVSQNKYGDCKALTNYFKSLLDFLEIKSYYATIYAGTPTRFIDKNFPSQQFNHAILYIPLEDEDIWLDLTSKGPFNYLGTFTQNRYSFIVTPNNSHFLKTPALSIDDVLETRIITINYDSEKATSTFKNNYKSNMFETISQIETNYNESNRTRILQHYFVENGFDLVDYQISTPHRDSVKIDFNYKATSSQIYKHYGNDILISNLAFSLPEFEKPEGRHSPVQLDYPIHKSDTITYQIPEGYKLNQGFENYSESNKFGDYNFQVRENGEEIIVTKSVLIHSGYYPITEYKDFYAFYEKILGVENKNQLVLNKII